MGSRSRRRAGTGPPASRPEGLVQGPVDREDLGQAGDVEDLEDAVLVRHELHRAFLVLHSFQPADEHTEAGGVEEVHFLHVDDDVRRAALHEVDQGLAEAGSGVHVDLASERDDAGAVLRPGLDVEVHARSISARTGHTERPPTSVLEVSRDRRYRRMTWRALVTSSVPGRRSSAGSAWSSLPEWRSVS